MTSSARSLSARSCQVAAFFLAFFLSMSLAIGQTRPISVTLDREAIDRINAEFAYAKRLEKELVECKAAASDEESNSTFYTIVKTSGVVALVVGAFFVGRELK